MQNEYGDLYTEAMARVRAAVDKPIASLFELAERRRKEQRSKRKSFSSNAAFPC